MPGVVPPVVGRDDEFFWAGVAEGRLLVRRCARCGRRQHPPSPMCPACASVEWDVEELSGRGTVHSWIVSRHPSRPDEDPRVIALVQLDEGVRLVSNLVDVAIDDVVNDMAVEVRFADVDGVRLPQFRPVAGSAG